MKHVKNFESFLNESLINEAFNSSIIQRLASIPRGGLGKSFFQALSKTGIAASEITNADITTATPQEALEISKTNPNAIQIYYSSTEKDNPYSDDYFFKTIKGDVVLAVVKGKYFMGLSYDKYASRKSSKAEYNLIQGGDTIGIDKTRSKYGSGLNTLKKMADVSDIVYVIDPDSVASSRELRLGRAASRQGATAFLDDKDFKKANMSRYEEILRQRAATEDIDKMIPEVIEELTTQIKDALSAKKMGQYGEVLIGNDPKGREIRMSDAANLMRNILDEYGRWVSDKENARKSRERHGEVDNYYENSSSQRAKNIKDYAAKVKNLNYAW